MKRSEFYAMMIIVIIMCSMSTVFAVSYQPQVIQPTKPYRADFYNGTASNDTYYTLLDTVSGSGILNHATISTTDDATNNQMFIKITIDGAAFETTCSVSNLGAGFCVSNGTNVFATSKGLFFQGPLYFKTSLKIEIKQTSGGDDTLRGSAIYALE